MTLIRPAAPGFLLGLIILLGAAGLMGYWLTGLPVLAVW